MNSTGILSLRHCRHVRCCLLGEDPSGEGSRGERKGASGGKSNPKDLTFTAAVMFENIREVLILMHQFNCGLELRFASLRPSNVETQQSSNHTLGSVI